MAAKRGASSDLNHDNWDHDEEPEDSGTFQRASDDSLKRRVIKTARRRNPISSVRDNGDESDKKSAFTSFSGFGKAPQPTTSAFSFLSNLANPKSPPKVNGIEGKSSTKSSDITTFKFNSNPVTSANPTDKSSDTKLSWTAKSEQITTNIFTGTSNPNSNPTNRNTDEQPNDYYSKLKGLNQSVSNWIKKHVDTNPFINLQPIFKDYEKYINELENEKDLKPDTSKNAVSSMSTFLFKPTANIPDSTTEKTQPVDGNKKAEPVVQKAEKTETVVSKFSFGSSVTSSGSVSTTPSFSFGTTKNAGSGLFSFGTTTTDSIKTTTTTSSFTFGVKPTTTNTTTGLPTFNSTTPFTFSNVAKPATVGDQTKEADDDEEPPQNDFTPVVEQDHIYTTRCKVFVKKDDKFGDRGVGNLFLKPIENSEKVQLIVRADTNLGNLLLNLILSDAIPVKRLGKKDVMLVCVPTPEAAPPPVPVLLRVKNGDEADELLGTLEKHKK